MLADLYLKADSYVPALETIGKLLALPEASTLSLTRRAALESKAISCRLSQGDAQGALGQCRDVLQNESLIENPRIRARVHLQCSEALFRIGRLDDSGQSADIGLRVADSCGDLSLAAQALNLIGRIAFRRGDLGVARDHYEQALALYRRIGETTTAAYVRNNLGLILKNLCEWEAAAVQLRAALETFRDAGLYALTGYPLLHLAIVHQKSGDWMQASESYLEAQRIFTRVADHRGVIVTAIGLGNLARLERRFAGAERLLADALERARAQSAQREEVLALEFLGELECDQGRPERALERYAEALRLGERIAEGDLVVEVERRRAEALAAVGRFDEAQRSCERAMRLAEQIQDRLEHALSHRVAGAIALRRGRREEAREIWKRTVALLSECHERYELGRTLMDLGRVAEGPAEARRHFYRAGALFADLSIGYWLEQSEAELARVLTTPPEPASARAPSLLGRRLRAPSLVACSASMRRVESLARRAAGTELSVLITGETGTGKELVARTIHGLSARSGGPFFAVNCGALRVELALSQLFGHRKGAFTGAHTDGVGLVEAANGGTLFLDEVGELPLDVQVTLLRFLESGEYLRLGETQVRRSDVRLIAATNRELRGQHEKQFRRDLLFRLNEIEIRLPALRDRREDIAPLARHFLAFYGGMSGPQLAPDADAVLSSHSWPGNVRELENVMKRIAALHSDAGEVDASALLPFLANPEDSPVRNGGAGAEDERTSILNAFAAARGNKSRVAEILGVSRKTLYARIKRLGIDLP